MCGMAGFSGSGSGGDILLAKMLADLRHRGPEGSSSMFRDLLALGHTHLAFTDLSQAAVQPMASTRAALTFNGEIFNHVELANAKCIARSTTSDTEVLLSCLEREGLEILPELNGFFAIAFVDFISQKLYLIRDRFGVKPLYYVHSGSLFGFASEIHPLRHLLPFTPDRDVVFHNLVGNWTQGTRTGINGIYRVQPGCYVEYDLRTGQLETKRWFSLADLRDDGLHSELHACPFGQIVERTTTALVESALRRATSRAPLAVLCSGGLDSGLLTAILANERPEIEAFSVDFPTLPNWSEFPWAESLGHHLGKTVHPVTITPERWRALFVKTAMHFEYPLWHESSISIAAIAEDLRRQGFKGVLGGDGADELFGGYDYKYLPQREAYAAWAHLPPALCTADPQEVVHDPILTELYGPYVPHPEDMRYRQEVWAMAAKAAHSESGAEHDLEAILATELHLFLGIVLCRMDRSLMQYGIEGREPYLDHELVRLAFNIPLRWKTQPRTKEILRCIAKPYLPDAILERKKRGFSLDPEGFLRGHMNPRFLLEANLRDYLQIGKAKWSRAVAGLKGRSVLRAAGGEIWFRSIFMNESRAVIEKVFWSA